MTTGAPGAVFFLGTRAHYQVLQQPDHFDAENGNTEIYQNHSTWKANGLDSRECCRYGLPDYNSAGAFAERAGYSVLNDINVTEEKDKDSMKRRNKRSPSEGTLCEDEMKPSQLNDAAADNSSPKEKTSRRSLLAFLSSLSRRKKPHGNDLQYLKHIESALTTCTYRESCRCLECQSSYFDCDDDDEDYYESDDSEYSMYVAKMQQATRREQPPDDDDDDEVFVDQVPSDNTSTDMLIEPKKMSVSSSGSGSVSEAEPMELEVAAGTPLLLNFLLTHPVTCTIQ